MSQFIITREVLDDLAQLQSLRDSGVVRPSVDLHTMTFGRHDHVAKEVLHVSPSTLAAIRCGNMTMPAEFLAQLLHVQEGLSIEQVLQRYCTQRWRKGNIKVKDSFIGDNPGFVEEWCNWDTKEVFDVY